MIRRQKQFLYMNDNNDMLIRYRKYLSQFNEFTDQEWSEISSKVKIRQLKKKDIFIKPFENNSQIAFIAEGILRTYFLSESGEEFTTDFCTANEIAVNYDITTSHKNEYFSQAVVDTTLLVMDYENFQNFVKNNPEFNSLISKIVEYYHPIKITREKNLLSMDAKGRYIFFMNKYKEIAHLIPQYQIASYLGITPIALSRVKKSL